MYPYYILWILFVLIAVILFIFDLKLSVFKPHDITLKESLFLCGIWIVIACSYGLLIGYFLNLNKMVEYFTAYIVEYSLSVDNMFVFLIIFSYFGIEKKYQPKILVIGILSAIVMRLIFIFTGIALISKFNWIIYIFAIVLLYTGFKMFFVGNEKIEPEKNPLLRVISKYINIDMNYKTGDFFIIKNGRLIPTIMIAVLIVIESTDIVFAVDSIPAVLGISQDRLIVYSSNIFAVIGLRSLYFALAAINDYFKYLKKGVAIVLIYVGFKMLFSHFIHIPPFLSLMVIIVILSISIIFSFIKK
ncbi:MAG: TerC/Alx family metal homeostasis membrane protein [Elusimicrobiota bacterium]